MKALQRGLQSSGGHLIRAAVISQSVQHIRLSVADRWSELSKSSAHFLQQHAHLDSDNHTVFMGREMLVSETDRLQIIAQKTKAYSVFCYHLKRCYPLLKA